MAKLSSKTVKELKTLAIGKGFKEEDLADLSKTQLIELVSQAEEGEATEKKQSLEVVDDLKGFKGSEIHIHETMPTGESKYVRSYSEEQHGEDFLENAKSFKSKKPEYFFVK